ncbi:MAG: glycosyltransferase [Firmicutes bacterium]|nr:glycosyltransferase [Bacillota bacterium]
MRYAVEMPTRDRNETLVQCLRAFEQQVPRPDFIVVVNNNTKGKQPEIPSLSLPLSIVKNRYPVPGPEQAHQTALEIFVERGIKVGVRWDDDLLPQQGCMKALLAHFQDPYFTGAVGGCYPRPGYPIWNNDGVTPLPLKHPPAHLQFFEWQNKIMQHVSSLYSGMMYSVDRALQVGGFCVEYSQLGYRGETDFSMRMENCRVEPHAVAIHLLSKGGVRTINNPIEVEKVDRALFNKRMKDNQWQEEL